MNEKLIGAVDKLFGLNTSAVIALGALCGVVLYGGWIVGSLYNDLRAVASEQRPDRLCARIRECALCDRIIATAEDAKRAILVSEQHITAHDKEADHWKQRIVRLEQQLYELQVNPKSRPDGFTGSMGRELESRIEKLELKP